MLAFMYMFLHGRARVPRATSTCHPHVELPAATTVGCTISMAEKKVPAAAPSTPKDVMNTCRGLWRARAKRGQDASSRARARHQ